MCAQCTYTRVSMHTCAQHIHTSELTVYTHTTMHVHMSTHMCAQEHMCLHTHVCPAPSPHSTRIPQEGRGMHFHTSQAVQ